MLTKEDLLARKVSSTPVELSLPDGEIVLAMPVGSKMMRDYRRCLRDEDGNPIESRRAVSDELLIARVLVDADGERIFSDDEVLAGALTDWDPATWDALMEFAWGFIAGGDREKKS